MIFIGKMVLSGILRSNHQLDFIAIDKPKAHDVFIETKLTELLSLAILNAKKPSKGLEGFANSILN